MKIWLELKKKSAAIHLTNDWNEIDRDMAIKGSANTIGNVVRKLVFDGAVYYVWDERNKRLFTQGKRSA
ncbi:hypothetical protein Tco_0541777, partial [Tanacetum coccineum]